jgi:hypothetical protein
MKRRSLVQHLCNNLHYHLLKNLLKSKLTLDLDWLDSNDVSAIGLLVMNLEMHQDNSIKLKLIRLLLKQGVNLDSIDSKKSPLLWCLYKHQF